MQYCGCKIVYCSFLTVFFIFLYFYFWCFYFLAYMYILYVLYSTYTASVANKLHNKYANDISKMNRAALAPVAIFASATDNWHTLHYPSPSFDHYLRPVDLSRCITIHTDDGRLTLKYSAINERVSAASAEDPGLISNNVTQMLNEFLVPQVNLRVVTRSWKLKAISHICRVIPGHRAIRAWDNEAGHKLLVALITSKITNRSQPRSVA